MLPHSLELLEYANPMPKQQHIEIKRYFEIKFKKTDVVVTRISPQITILATDLQQR